MVTPIIRSLHEDVGAEIVTVGDAAFRQIYADLPGVIAHIDLPSGEPGYWDLLSAGLKARRFRCDAALCLRFQRRCTIVASAAGCRIRVGALAKDKRIGYRLTNNVHSSEFASMHQVEKYYRVAELAAGRPLRRLPTVFRPRLDGAEKSWLRRLSLPYVVVHVGNGGSNLDWGDENFALLVRELRDRSYVVVLTGDGKSKSFYSMSRSAATMDLAGQLSLNELAEVYADASVVIALDGGGGRLASAVGTPIVNIAIGSHWTTEQVRPWLAPGIVVEPRARCTSCGPGQCNGSGKKCVETLKLEDVLRAVATLSTDADAIALPSAP